MQKRAIVYILIGMAVIGLIDNFMRFLTPSGSLWQFHFLRACVSLSLLWIALMVFGAQVRPRALSKVALRSALAGVSTLLYFAGLGLMPITEVVAGLFTAPFFVVLYERALFGVKIDRQRLLAVTKGFSGIVIGLGVYHEGIGLRTIVPVLAGALYGAANLYTKRALQEESPLAILTGYSTALGMFGVMGLVAFAFMPPMGITGAEGFVWRGWQQVDAFLIGLVLFHGLGALVGMGFAAKAYMLGDTTTISVCENALLVFTALFAFVLFGEEPSLEMGIGMALIFVAGVLISSAPARPTPKAVEAA